MSVEHRQGTNAARLGRRALLVAFTAVSICLMSASSWAGAFNIPENSGLAILDFTLSQGSRYFNGLGKAVPADRFRRVDGSLYLEYGITDWLMAIVQPDLRGVSIDDVDASHYFGLGESQIGAQVKVMDLGPAVVAVQGSIHLPGTTSRDNLAMVGQTAHGAEVRTLFGLNFDLGSWPAFLDAQLAYRYRDAGAAGQIHADLTLGVRPWERWLFLIQMFATDSIGRSNEWFPRERSIHVGPSLVFDVTPEWSVQLGGFTTILARRSLREQGVTLALWYRF